MTFYVVNPYLQQSEPEILTSLEGPMAENTKGYAIVGENGQYSDPVFETRAEAEAHRGPAQDVVAVEHIDQAIASWKRSHSILITRAQCFPHTCMVYPDWECAACMFPLGHTKKSA